MTLSARTHAVQHAVQHAVHEAVHDAVHRLLHHGHHRPGHRHGRLVHLPRPGVVHAAGAEAVQDLEGRMLMSAAHLTALAPLSAKPTHAPAVTIKSTTPTATLTTTAGPVAVADPAVTDRSFSYQSFAGDSLFAPAGPSISDVSQGELGDCYLLSVLSSVAKTDSTLIRQMVTANANGTYTVTFDGSKGTKVTVNSDLATLPGGRPAYAQLGTDNSLWVAILEKAYADFVNPRADSYATISGGWMGDAFSALGLKSTSTFAATSPTSLATLLQKDLRANDFVTLGTVATLPGSNPLVAGHAYEIDSVSVGKTGAITSVTLRNPWGNDIAGGGYVTVTAQQAFAAFAGLSVSHT